MSDAYIVCIMVRCGEIGTKALETFHKHHPNLVVNIYCSYDDIKYIPQHKNQVLHIIAKDSDIYTAFNSGHKGTAMVYAKAILEAPCRKIVHFDSDIYFRQNIVDDIIDKLDEYDIVGPIRNYKHNPNKRDDVRNLEQIYPNGFEITQTYCFGFNRDKINITDHAILSEMCNAIPVGLEHNVIDFFDPVAFTILKNGGKVYHYDIDFVGGCDFYGKRINKYGKPNTIFDVGDALIHFAGIGSGQNFVNMLQTGQNIYVPQFYVSWSIKRYDIYCKLFLNREILEKNEEEYIIPEIKPLLN